MTTSLLLEMFPIKLSCRLLKLRGTSSTEDNGNRLTRRSGMISSVLPGSNVLLGSDKGSIDSGYLESAAII